MMLSNTRVEHMMGISHGVLWESYGNGNYEAKLIGIEIGMGIKLTGKGGNGNFVF